MAVDLCLWKKRCCLGGIGFRGHGEFPIGGSWKEGQMYIQKRSLLFRRYLYMSSETTNTSYVGGLALDVIEQVVIVCCFTI